MNYDFKNDKHEYSLQLWIRLLYMYMYVHLDDGLHIEE